MSVALSSQAEETTTRIIVPTPDEISKSLEQLQTSFAILVTRLHSRLEDHIENQKIKLKDVARFVEENLDIGGLTNVESIDKLFNCIQCHYYFLNCEIIKCIADEFLIKEEDNDLQEKMRDYMHKLEGFKKSAKLLDFLSAIRTALPSRNNPTTVKIALTFNSQWKNQTIKGLKSLLLHYFDRDDLFNYIQMKYQGKNG